MPAIPLSQLTQEPYATILCYPKPTKTELKKRLNQLQKHGITALQFTGNKQILNTHVLGKGCVGIVTIAHKNKQQLALKIRRTDADRTSMQHEAKLLKKANQQNIGPRLYSASRDFLTMQLIEGQLLPTWLQKQPAKTRTRKVLKNILVQCWKLDKAHLDHGELSRAPKHIIITKTDNPVIVDFETASTNRKPSNLTSICQYLFLNPAMSAATQKLPSKDRKALIDALRNYKKDMTPHNFRNVLESCGL